MVPKTLFLLVSITLYLPLMAQTKSSKEAGSSIAEFLFMQVDSLRNKISAQDRELDEFNNRDQYMEGAIEFLFYLQKLERDENKRLMDSTSNLPPLAVIEVPVTYLAALGYTSSNAATPESSMALKKLFSHYPILDKMISSGRIKLTMVQGDMLVGSSAPPMLSPVPRRKIVKASPAKEQQLKKQMMEILAFQNKGCNSILINDYLIFEAQKQFTVAQQFNNRQVLIEVLKKQCKK